MDTFLKVLGALVLIGAIGVGGCVACTLAVGVAADGVVVPGPGGVKTEPLVTLREFEQLSTGMSYEEAVAIIGAEGDIQSENEIMGIRTVMYTWSNGIANMNAMFQDNKLMSKAQIGLR